MYVCIPPRSSMRPVGVPMCFTPEKQQAAGAEASVEDILRLGEEVITQDNLAQHPFILVPYLTLLL